MTMEEDNRPEDNPGGEDADAGWYFDLPNGAWERQEAKNRELRESVRRNINTDPPKDVFGGVKKDQDDDADPMSAWGALQELDAPTRKTSWSFQADQPPADDELPGSTARPAADSDYSTEPENASSTPFKLRPRDASEDDDAPRLRPPAGLFGFGGSDDAADEPAEEIPPLRTFSSRALEQEPLEPTPFVRSDGREHAEGERPKSRWDDLFGEKASEGASMLEGMRNWAHQSESDAPLAYHDVPAAGITGNDEAEDVDPSAPIPIRVPRHAEDEPPLVNTDVPQTRWDEMFGRKGPEDTGLLDSMRAWASSSGEEDAPPPRFRLAGDDEPAEQDPVEPFEWEAPQSVADAPVNLDAWRDAPAEEKKGVFGKLFGKRKKAEPPAFASDAWRPADESPADYASVPQDSDDIPRPVAWLGRSDGAENRFSDRTEPAWPPAMHSAAAEASGWGADDDDPTDRPVRLPQDDLPPIEHGEERLAAWRDPEPSDDDKNRFSELSTWFANRGEAVDDGASAAVPQAETAADATSDVEMWEPASWETPSSATGETAGAGESALTPAALVDDEDAGWDPEPFAAVDANDPVTPEADYLDATFAEPTAEMPVDPSPVGDETIEDEDAWEPALASEAEVTPAVGENEPATDDAPRIAYDIRAEDMAPEGAEPAAVAPAPGEEGESLWDSAFARVHGEAMAEDEPAAAEYADDPWAAITQVTGYDERAGGVPPFRASAEVESALHRYEAEREAEEAYHATSEEAFPSADDADQPNAPLPAWDDSNLEDDTVLRAFQAHASAFDDDEFDTPPASADTDSLVFDDLLGEDAEDIVAEASQPAADNRYFGRMQGWAPQRTPGERQPFPWEKDAQEPARTPDASEEAATSLEGWSRVEEAPVPWSAAPTSAVATHAEAPSARRKSRSKVLVREIVETGLLALLVFLSVRASFQNFKVDGYSMWPTLEDGEYLIVNKLAYSEVDMDRLSNFVPFVDPGEDPSREVFGGPTRGDIVVLKDPRETDTDLIKRIIGMPGETLEIVDGKVYINDMLLIEPYIKDEWNDDKEKLLIPPGHYFVMGDNRNNSMDSRSSQIALIPKDLLIGKAMLTYWPTEKFGLAPNGGGDISEKDGRPVVTAERVPE